MIVPSRRSGISSFIAMDVMSAAAMRERGGASVIHMEVGEPGAPAPAAVRGAAAEVLAHGRIGYTEALGLPALQARIAEHYRAWYGAAVSPDRVVITTGSSGGFVLTFLALFDKGARIGIASPGYPAYRNILHALDLEAVDLPIGAESRYVVDADMVRAAHGRQQLDGLLLMSPANPSGTMLPPDDLRAVAETCAELGIRFISDEIYHGLTYGMRAETAINLSPDAVVVNSFSKYFCMTGWRIGWLVVPDSLVRPMEKLQQNLSISVPTLSQHAALAAFDAHDELETVRQSYAVNRATLLGQLPAIGFDDIHPVDGAFYVYADVGRFTNDSVAFCQRMLADTGVAATPGLDFDRARGHRTMRFSFAGSNRDIDEAVVRLREWLR